MTARPAVPRLMLVTEAARSRLPLLQLAKDAAAGGVDAIYLRDVRLRSADLASLVRKLRDVLGPEVAILVSGGAETALTAGAGLHLRERDALPVEARAKLRPDVLIGRSVHSVEEARNSPGADYLLAGHVYPSASKPGQPPLGLTGLTAIVAAAPCPVIAIGGITAERVPEVIRAGAHGVAVIGALVEANNPRAAASALLAALNTSIHDHKEACRVFNTNDTTSINAVEISVNGKTVTVAAGDTVHDFLASKRMTDAMAIVERNGEIIPRPAYATTPLTPGDRLEVVHAVGGG